MTNPRTIRTSRRRARFLEALGESAIVTRAARAAGGSRSAFYEWRREDPDFARDWDDAVELGVAALEDEAIRRARDGVEAPVYYAGRPVGTVRKTSDTLLMFLLRAHKPERYREPPAGSRRHLRNHADTPPGQHSDPDDLTPEQRDLRIRQILTRMGMKIVYLEDNDSRDPESPEKLPFPLP